MRKARASSSALHRVACPHLGREGARHAPQGRPSDLHRCFVDAPEQTITRRHQAQFCLSPDWSGCYKLAPDYIPVGSIPTLAADPLPVVEPTTGPAEPPPAQAVNKPLSLAAQRLLSRVAGKQGDAGSSVSPALPGRMSAFDPGEIPSPVSVPSASKELSQERSEEEAASLTQTAAEPVPAAAVVAVRDGSTSWQTPVLWMAVAVPAILLLVVASLIAVMVGNAGQAQARSVLEAVATVEEEEFDIEELVAPTPLATFVSVGVNPDASPVAPTIPAAARRSLREPIRPGPWPEEAATGSPDRIRAPAVGIDAPVIPVGSYIKEEDGAYIRFYEVAEYAAGWHNNSSLPGFKGNVVLAGHHNIAGKVFEHAVDLEPGDFVFLDVDGRTYPYLVVIKEIFLESTVSDEQRAENGRWIAQTEDERLTLVTCWPPTGNSHRVIVVAIPAR